MPTLPLRELENPSGISRANHEHIHNLHADIANLTSNDNTYELVSEHLIPRAENREAKDNEHAKWLENMFLDSRVHIEGVDEDISSSASDLCTRETKQRKTRRTSSEGTRY